MSFKSVIEKIIGTYSDRELKKILPIRDQVLALEETMASKSDRELREMTDQFKARLREGETTDDILPEAFAVCREGRMACSWNEAFPRSDCGRYCSSSGKNR